MSGQNLTSDPLAGQSRFVALQELGAGTFGRVLLAEDRERGQKVAIKLINRGPRSITVNVEREIIAHRRSKHPHIVKLKEVFLLNDYLAIVMEFADQGNMYTYITQKRGGRLTEEEARWFFQQLIIAVDYLHNNANIVIRDIKLENALLATSKNSKGHLLKLCDFGYAKPLDVASVPNSRVGTLCYMAPEVLQQPTYGKAADLWSCGVLLYTMLVGQYPFMWPDDGAENNPGAQQLKLIGRIQNGNYYPIPAHLRLSELCTDMIRRLLTVDPAQRITLEEVKQHPWFAHGLPLGALNLNRTLNAIAETDENIQQVKDMVRVAQQAPSPAPRDIMY